MLIVDDPVIARCHAAQDRRATGAAQRGRDCGPGHIGAALHQPVEIGCAQGRIVDPKIYDRQIIDENEDDVGPRLLGSSSRRGECSRLKEQR